MKLALVDWTIILAYGVLILVAGLYFTRRASRSMVEFFVSGRALPWWLAGTSMVATTFSADTPLLVTSIVRREGVAGNWIWVNFAISHALTTFFLAALWRRAKVVTDVELCERRYSGPPGRALRLFKGTFYAFVTNSVILGWVLLAMAAICGEVMGLPKLTTLILSVGVATLYTTFSGLWGVVATDFPQFIIAMAGSIVLLVKALSHMGGVSALAPKLPALIAENGQPAMNLIPSLTDGALGGFLVALGVQWWSWKYADGGGVLIQRMSASKDERHSVLAMLWFTFANYVVRPWPWFMVALISLIVFPQVTDPKAVYPMMMTRFLGPGWLGFMMAAILAAFMSTVDTHINLGASYFVNDIYRRFLRQGRTERHYILVARIASLLFLCIGASIAFYSTSIVRLFEFLLQLVAGAGVVFLLRWFWWRINAWSEITAMTSSLVVATLLNLANRYSWFGHTLTTGNIILINVVGSGALWLTVTLLTRPCDPGHLRAFYDQARPPGWWGPIATASARDEAVAAVPLGRAADGGAAPALPRWSPRHKLECFLLTLILVYGAMAGVGYLFYGRRLSGAVLCLVALLAACRIGWNLRPAPAGPQAGGRRMVEGSAHGSL